MGFCLMKLPQNVRSSSCYAAASALCQATQAALQYQGTGVTFSIGYPPDTSTPGYEEESKTKVCAVFHMSILACFKQLVMSGNDCCSQRSA